MPEVIVKTTPGLIPDFSKGRLAYALAETVAEVLSVPGTQAELHLGEVEVDFQEFSSSALRNGIDCAITVMSNLYPERDGKADEYAERIELQLQSKFPTSTLLGSWYVWVLLAQGGFRENRRKHPA